MSIVDKFINNETKYKKIVFFSIRYSFIYIIKQRANKCMVEKSLSLSRSYNTKQINA